jgi:NTE family protein
MSRALVLSGGGPVGIAWQSGLAVGLADAGIDLAAADAIVGTSAGSAVGAQLALHRDMRAVVDRYRQRADSPPVETVGGPGRAGMGARMQRLMELMAEAAVSEAPPEESRKKLGRFALDAETAPEESFLSGFAHLAGEVWPASYRCTAVDAETGEFVVWDESSGAPLDRAVASSCAVPGVFPPITILGRRYIDGGMRSGTNADLVAGHDRVLIVSLTSPPKDAPPPVDPRMARYRARMDAELAVLTDRGAQVELVGPDEATAAVIGMNLMNPALAPAAAEEGVRQGGELAPMLADFWR